MNMQRELAQNEPAKIKVNKQTAKKLQKLVEAESEDVTQKVSLQAFMADKKILRPRDDFFTWLTEELRKLKAEDDFKSIGRK